MEFLKELFTNGPLTWELFEKAVTDKGFKVANLASGKYIDKSKYDDDLLAKDTTIKTLNDTISTRDKDIADFKKQLEDNSTGEADVINLKKQLEELQIKYDNDTKTLNKQIADQKYLDLAKEYANKEKFSSNAARDMFISKLVEKQLKIENDILLGADDFTKLYKESNADSFAQIESPKTQQFTSSTMGSPVSTSDYENRLADARNNGRTAEAIAIKREAAENGVMLM